MNEFEGINYEDEIDIRPHIAALIQKWRWIAGTGLVMALAVFAVTLQMPAVYGAEATVAISPSRTEVQFDSRIQTLADYELVNSALVTRRDALVALVKSNEVLQAVLADVRDDLMEEERTLEWLRDVGTVETAGDLINLEVRYADPETAALIANTWTADYERHVNQVYSRSGNSSDTQIVEQVSDARQTYSAAQSTLEAFEAASPIEMLQREIDATLAILDNYQQARIAAQTRPADRSQEVLNSYYQELLRIEGWLADATALREQVAQDSSSEAGNLGNTLALITLRSRVFGGNNTEGGSAIFLQFDLASTETQTVRTADVEALISVLEARKAAAQERIDAFLAGSQEAEASSQIAQLNERIDSLTAQVANLRGELEAARAEQRELTQARDNAWETYQLLLSQQVEEQVASQTTSTEVRIADRAIVPEEPLSRGLIRNTALAGMLGALVAAGVVLVRAWWTMDDVAEERIEATGAPGERQQIAREGETPEEQATGPRAPDRLPT